MKGWARESKSQRSVHGKHGWPIWLQCMFFKKLVQLAFEHIFASVTCHGLKSSLIMRMPLWLSGKCSQPFGCFAFTSIIKHGPLGTSGCLGGIHRILRETSKLLAGFFTWGIYLSVKDLRTRRLHVLCDTPRVIEPHLNSPGLSTYI